jgi:hypothetical protein
MTTTDVHFTKKFGHLLLQALSKHDIKSIET